MASEKQIAANRRNAQASTGPRTGPGKARVAQNAVQHGLTAERVILPGEDPGDFQQFRDELWNALAPCGALEEVLAATVVAQAWRQRRIVRLDAALSTRHLQQRIIEAA